MNVNVNASSCRLFDWYSDTIECVLECILPCFKFVLSCNKESSFLLSRMHRLCSTVRNLYSINGVLFSILGVPISNIIT